MKRCHATASELRTRESKVVEADSLSLDSSLILLMGVTRVTVRFYQLSARLNVTLGRIAASTFSGDGW